MALLQHVDPVFNLRIFGSFFFYRPYASNLKEKFCVLFFYKTQYLVQQVLNKGSQLRIFSSPLLTMCMENCKWIPELESTVFGNQIAVLSDQGETS